MEGTNGKEFSEQCSWQKVKFTAIRQFGNKEYMRHYAALKLRWSFAVRSRANLDSIPSHFG